MVLCMASSCIIKSIFFFERFHIWESLCVCVFWEGWGRDRDKKFGKFGKARAHTRTQRVHEEAKRGSNLLLLLSKYLFFEHTSQDGASYNCRTITYIVRYVHIQIYPKRVGISMDVPSTT